MDAAGETMTDFLLCVLIGTVATGFSHLSIQADRDDVGAEAPGILILGGLLFGGILYGLLRLIVWLIGRYGGGLV